MQAGQTFLEACWLRVQGGIYCPLMTDGATSIISPDLGFPTGAQVRGTTDFGLWSFYPFSAQPPDLASACRSRRHKGEALIDVTKRPQGLCLSQKFGSGA